ncbi:tRNA pseudouridine 55 synthase [Thiovulum sp. ES]|nr:tRNA pseudouridine 55 synthase [Thiovulum sp. ES]
MNRLFVVEKPIFRSSNSFLGRTKKKYREKKGGFSGTLDPFAGGNLIVAFGQYTKLFQYLPKTPKKYRAVLWFGAESETLDIEKISKIEDIPKFDLKLIQKTLDSFVGNFRYLPPKYSAKKIAGKRAYNLARNGEAFQMNFVESEIYKIDLITYRHPFLTFEAEVSEGTYIRSLGFEIAQKLGTSGSLSYLWRIAEGKFKFENEKSLNPLDFLEFPENRYLGDTNDIFFGKKLKKEKFEKSEKGKYILKYEEFFSIIEIGDEVKYLLNKISNFS